MLCQIITAGFGGQGILFLGDLLTRSALAEGKHVTYLPTYGVAMRGGTANCVVTVADEEIGSPVLDQPHVGIIMNQQSLLKFQPQVRQGGLLVVNESIVSRDKYTRNGDVRNVWVRATELARDVAGTERSANMVALGAFLASEPLVGLDTIEAVLREHATGAKAALVEKNLAALKAGMEAAEEG